jgi:predicted DNA-binding transcriptional regulator AlpA
MKVGSVLDVKPLLTQRDLARLLGLAESTMETWRLVGKGPKFIRLAAHRHVRYPSEEVRKWILTQVGTDA